MALCRDLVNDPPNILTPERFAEVVTRETRGTHHSHRPDDQALRTGGFGGILGVSAGSSHGARLVTMSHRRAAPAGRSPSSARDHLRLRWAASKTPAGMLAMKTDMAGAAAVACAVPRHRPPAPADRGHRLPALAENMPGASAQRPGDVVAIRGGRTVEIVDTDAEGRMVLADALALASESTPEAIVDIATLTGAQITALGPRIGAVLANDEQLQAEVVAAGTAAGSGSGRYLSPTTARRHCAPPSPTCGTWGRPTAGCSTPPASSASSSGRPPPAHPSRGRTSISLARRSTGTTPTATSPGADGYGV